MPEDIADCLIVGAGPAGLVAATYLARFRRRVRVFDDGRSRAAAIPCTHNCPGFPDGIAGTELLVRLRLQAERYGVQIEPGFISEIQREATRFAASAGTTRIYCRKVLLATGVVDLEPKLPNTRELIFRGEVRLCPICDGYEVRDREIAVMGPICHALQKLAFLGRYSSKLILLRLDTVPLSSGQMDWLDRSGIRIPDGIVADVKIEGSQIIAEMSTAETIAIDVLYPAMGASPRSGLLAALGGNMTSDGCIVTDNHQHTSVAGVYAAGDVVNELNQIAVAGGHAAIAATAIHNSLRSEDGEIPPG